MATAEDVISQVLRRLDELDPDSPVRWTRPEILVYLNEALTELNLISLEFQGSADLSIDSSNNVYSVPDPIIAISTVYIDNRYLRRTTVDQLDYEIKWDVSDLKEITPKIWAPLGLNKLVIVKKPHAAKTARLEGVKRHTAVTDSAEDLPCRTEYIPAIEDFCVHRATFRDGGYELNHAEPFYTNFLTTAQDLSGRKVVSSYPRYAFGGDFDEQLRTQNDRGSQ
jgi:hypothetical protein